MGRIFETRKSTMMARWDRMAKAFTRIAKDITIAVKAGGPHPNTNPALRRAFHNAKACNMPKDKVDAAVKRASGQEQKNYEVVLYEGYAPHGVALLVEATTDNAVRTVANVRMHFKNYGGHLGNTGSVSFLFQHMGVFCLPAEGINQETLELNLIDYGLQEMGERISEHGERQFVIRCAFQHFGQLQAALEAQRLQVSSAESEYTPLNHIDLPSNQAHEVLQLVDALEADSDVHRVFHTLA